MEINVTKLVDGTKQDALVTHIIIHSIAHCLKDKYKIEKNDDGEAIVQIDFKINGLDVDLTVFAEHWQSQVDRMIHEKAQEIVDEYFQLTGDYLHDLQEVIKEKIRIIDPNYEDYNA